jgi:hypothetical protein
VNLSRTCKPAGIFPNTRIVAPCKLTTAATKAKPSPLPGVERLASSRQKRRKTLSRSDAGDAGPVVSDRHLWPIYVSWGLELDLDTGAGGRVPYRALDQIGEHLGEQSAVARNRDSGRDFPRQRLVLFFGRWAVDLQNVIEHRRKVDGTKDVLGVPASICAMRSSAPNVSKRASASVIA